jgi:3-hydroxyisobutyrate dehydrogenase
MTTDLDGARMDLGVIGLGPMGQALAAALIAAGHNLTVWDRDAAKVATTAMLGASTAVNARQVAGESDVVFTVLPGRDAVLEVALDDDSGIMAGLREGGLMLDMTTADPGLARILDRAFSTAGRRFVDAPVSGKAPRMSILLGATRAELDHDTVSLLNDVASALIYCGARGSGYAAKLINQHIKYASYLASAEALLIAQRYGLQPRTAIDAVTASSGWSRGFGDAAAYFLHDTTEIQKHAAVTTIAKDMRLAAELADSQDVASPTLSAVNEFFAQAAVSQYAADPFPASIALLEKMRINGQAGAHSQDHP